MLKVLLPRKSVLKTKMLKDTSHMITTNFIYWRINKNLPLHNHEQLLPERKNHVLQTHEYWAGGMLGKPLSKLSKMQYVVQYNDLQSPPKKPSVHHIQQLDKISPYRNWGSQSCFCCSFFPFCACVKKKKRKKRKYISMLLHVAKTKPLHQQFCPQNYIF